MTQSTSCAIPFPPPTQFPPHALKEHRTMSQPTSSHSDFLASVQRHQQQRAERAQYDAAIAADERAERERREAERLAALAPLTDSERLEIEALLLPELMRMDPERAEHWGNYVLRGWN